MKQSVSRKRRHTTSLKNGEAPVTRKPVVKDYGAKSKYQAVGQSPYEQRRAARKAKS